MAAITEITKDQYIAGVINSIKDNHEALRDKSKPATFAMQYAGTWRTLVKNCGFSAQEAQHTERSYRTLFKVSDDWVAHRIAQAQSCGYVQCAFGLKVRTPLLPQVVLGQRDTPFEAEAEARTAGNALGQSWCQLTMRAANEFRERLQKSEYRLDVKICAFIHDAIYLLVRDNPQVLHWVNINLIECMQWQDDPAIAHDEVSLGAELMVHFESWKQPIKIPNNASPEEIVNLCTAGAKHYNDKKRNPEPAI